MMVGRKSPLDSWTFNAAVMSAVTASLEGDWRLAVTCAVLALLRVRSKDIAWMRPNWAQRKGKRK